MADRDLFAVDGTSLDGAALLGRQMSDDLVVMQVEIDPGRAGPALAATQQFAIETPRSSEIINRESQVETRTGHEVMPFRTGFAACP